MNKRIFFSDNGSLRDLSPTLNKFNNNSENIPFVSGQDAIFIGSRLPFNHIYIKLHTVNSISSNMIVTYSGSNSWQSVVELTDETEGLTKSGLITFVPNKNSSWAMQTDSATLAGLENTTIYDLYWLKIVFSNTLSGGTDLKWIGNLFSDDYDLEAEYPDLMKPAVLENFKQGKINWQAQHVRAAEVLISDLITKNIIDDGDQILIGTDYKNAAICKVAEIVYTAFGDDFLDDRRNARGEYEARLNKRVHRIDLNANGAEEFAERKTTSGWLNR